jgi:hypothetical protein
MAKTSTLSSPYIRAVLIVLAGGILTYLASEYYKNNMLEVSEKFEETVPTIDIDSDIVTQNAPSPEIRHEIVGDIKENIDKDYPVLPSEDELNEQYKPIDYKQAQVANDCFPRDKLTADDLLPKDAANSKWAQVNPAGQGELKNQNFLTAGYHTGINTVGTTLRNANRQLRSDPPNPQVKVSPWNQTTILPDLNRRPLEISGSD